MTPSSRGVRRRAPDLVGKNRGELLEEGIQLLQLLTSEGAVTFEGRHYRTHSLEMYPKPVHQPLRVLVGGHQQVAIDRALAFGQGWLPGWRPFRSRDGRRARLAIV